MAQVDERRTLREEIAAFYAGFGQPDALRTAFHEAPLLVPLTDDDRVSLSNVGGIDWLCAFTGIEEYAKYMTARGYLLAGGIQADREYRYHSLLGSQLVAYAQSRAEPTGISIDAVSSAPMAFPPDVSDID
ncbi:hypothetical protein [Nocardia callitridis]|uniref:SseB protein N-terminal domain-containing protein n=1 Tax=Nocardia callitridis TaxID=648753 RepID=A0ABP9L1L3_9NOCA